MRTEFVCEVCGSHAHTLLGARTYARRDVAQAGEYRAKRLRVLFETWFPQADEVRFSAAMCRECGFVCHLPRAEFADVDAKYRALAQLGQDYGRSEAEGVAVRRSQDLHAAMRRVLPTTERLSVLDYGGGDGRLMHAFVARGHDACLVDYNTNPLSNVRKLSDTLRELPADARFDLVVANHVLEHVAEPVQTLRELGRYLQDGGFLFVEVPMEIWARAPLADEPVTHINFFVCGSLRRALEESGFVPLSVQTVRSLHPTGRYSISVRAIARRREGRIAVSVGGAREVTTLLRPSLWARARRRVLLAGGVYGLLPGLLSSRVSGGGK